MTISGAFGSYFFKLASGADFKTEKIKLVVHLAIGGSLYFLGAVLNIIVLKFLPYTIVFPLTSITYIWTFVISYLLLKEKLTIKKIIGLAFIFIGCLFLVL